MKGLELRANAKLNLTLDITGLRDDGYHLMDMINLSVSLYDEVRLVKNEGKGVRICSKARFVPSDERNLAYRAAKALSDELGLPLFPVDISIKKKIPTRAGLGGGSADAAAVLRGLVRLFSLEISEERLLSAGAKVGADVPFCMTGGLMRVGGIGEQLEPLDGGCNFFVGILMPNKGRSTAEAFASIDSASGYARPDTAVAANALKSGELGILANNLINVFDTASPARKTAALTHKLMRCGALGASLTGSGAAVFGLFERKEKADAVLRLKGDFSAFSAAPAAAGVEIVREF